jgi:hypothetical protein
MNRFTLILWLAVCLQVGNVQAQHDLQKLPIQTAYFSQLEGVTLKNGHSLMLVISNVRIQKSGGNIDKITAANQALAPTLLQKVGGFEIHKINRNAAASDKPEQARQDYLFQGKTVPVFAETGSGQDYVGTAYLHDVQKMGLISKEVAVKFNTGVVPARYTGLGAKELVKGSGLYVFQVNDIYAWLNLVSSLQEDSQVDLVEPHIVTAFDKPN